MKCVIALQVNVRDISILQMSTNRSKCREIGAVVRTKATNVTSVAECKRKYGSNFKIATMTGEVVNVIVPQKGSRKQTSLKVDWTIG